MKSLRIVFWNTQKKAANISLILQYAKNNDVDIVALCEAKSIEMVDSDYVYYAGTGYEDNGIALYAKKSIKLYCTREHKRFISFRIESPIACNLVVVHLNSELSRSADRYRDADVDEIKQALLTEEFKYKDKNSLVIGDVNENLFDRHLTELHGFNVRYFRFQMESGVEKRHGNEYDLFYSPLLQAYKDNENKNEGKGTYYFENEALGWLCYDQVLMKAPLVPLFDEQQFEILQSLTPTINLVENNRPVIEYSDHLPIKIGFKWKEAL